MSICMKRFNLLRVVAYKKVPPIYGPPRDKNCVRGFGINKGADQPAHLGSLINAYVVH